MHLYLLYMRLFTELSGEDSRKMKQNKYTA